MKTLKVALIAPGYLPIPNFFGGAIETLATKLIEENEKQKLLDIHVFSFLPKGCDKPSDTKNVHFHYFKINIFIKMFNLVNRVVFKFSKYVVKPKNYLSNKFNKHNKLDCYDAIIVDGNHAQLYSIKPLHRCFMYFHITPKILPVQKSDEIMNSIGGIVVISDYVKRFLVNNTKINESQITTILNCCDTSKYMFSQTDREEIRQKYDIRKDACVFVFCGRLAEGKGIEDIIKAFLNASLTNSVLLVVGSVWFNSNRDNDFSNHLKKLSQDNHNIIFTGFISNDEIRKYYSAADVFVSPSKCNEAAGLVNIEAAANGLHIITSKDGGIPEYVEKFNVSYVGINRIESLKTLFEEFDKLSIDKGIKRKFLKDELDAFSVKKYYLNIVDTISRKKNKNGKNC